MQARRISLATRQAGFTLLEMIVVLVIIGLIMGLVGPRLFGQADKAKVQTAGTQIKMLGGALQTMRLDISRWPTEAEGLALLTSKPALYVCNVDEGSAATGNAMTKLVEDYARQHNAAVIVISAEIESQLAQLPDEEQAEYLESLGLSEPGLNRLIREAYQLLGLQTYFTAGPKEARAWTIHKGDRAPQAAGVIHTDFERGFIRAQTIAFDDYVSLGGEVPAKEAGKARDEGKDYVVKDGDVMLFKFNT